MEKSSLIKTLWNAWNSDEIADKHAACEIALKSIAGEEGFATLCAIDGSGNDVGEALVQAEEDASEPDADMVEALIRNATS